MTYLGHSRKLQPGETEARGLNLSWSFVVIAARRNGGANCGRWPYLPHGERRRMNVKPIVVVGCNCSTAKRRRANLNLTVVGETGACELDLSAARRTKRMNVKPIVAVGCNCSTAKRTANAGAWA